jgi:acetyltransferase-like isoleucine patch superfamily enzyme
MMNGILMFNRLNFLMARIFTLLSRKAFGAFGKGSLLYFPNYYANTGRIFIGNDVILMARCWIMTISEWKGRVYNGEIHIGDRTVITSNIQISACSRVSIGNGSTIGQGSAIVDHLHDYGVLNEPIVHAPITEGRPVDIGDEVFIGVNCIIAPGVSIGRHCFIGANSVVIDDLPAYSMATGNPAKIIRHFDPESGKWQKS